MRNTVRLAIVVLLSFCFAAAASAQSSSTLVLDASSLTPVNLDPITGLAIDPIGKDRSNRPCARIKLHINRMTPEEISGIQVRTIGGSVIVMKHTLAYDGNGIIIELTAKPDTRFYLHHDKWGDSNPVEVNLEGNKEYRMEAWNDIVLPVTVVCMTPGAEVYLDDTYVGRIGQDNMLTVQGVSSGSHDLRLISGEDESFQRINVSSEAVTFNVALRNRELLHGMLTFNLTPSEAILEIDGETLTSEDGVIERRTKYGTYTYRVSLEGYHDVEGEVSIDTTDVSRTIVLKPMLTDLTLNAEEDVKLWLNGKKMGTGDWRGTLSPGTYELKAKKGGYYPSLSTFTLTPEMSDYTVDAPVPDVPYENNLFVLASASVYPSLSYGLMAGFVKTVGGYVRFRSNFDFTSGEYTASSDCTIDGGGYLWPSGARTESVLNVSGGLLFRLAKSVYPYVGLGYGSRKVLWQDTDGKWVGISDYSFGGVSVEAGAVFRLGPVALSAGVSSTAFKYTAAEVGIGVAF